jgi:hypothetical protein
MVSDRVCRSSGASLRLRRWRHDRRAHDHVYIATSADGCIARPDGGVEWLDRPRPQGSYGMSAFYQPIDTTLCGRLNASRYDESAVESYLIRTRDCSRMNCWT